MSGYPPTTCPYRDIVTLLKDERFLQLVSTRGVPAAAARIGFSERTLRRAAASLGTNIRALLAEFHCKTAEALLRAGRPVSWVAVALGYSRVASFARFVSKECGMPPSALRRCLLRGRVLSPPPEPPVSPQRLAEWETFDRNCCTWPEMSC